MIFGLRRLSSSKSEKYTTRVSKLGSLCPIDWADMELMVVDRVADSIVR